MRTSPSRTTEARRHAAWLVIVALASCGVWLQAQGRGGQAAPPQTARAMAPIGLTGYWTAVITEDWHVRMLTAPKGDFGSGAPGAIEMPGGGKIGTGPNPAFQGNVPYKPEGALAALRWDPAKDENE